MSVMKFKSTLHRNTCTNMPLHTRTHTHTLTHTHSLSLTHTYAHTYTDTLSHTHAHSQLGQSVQGAKSSHCGDEVILQIQVCEGTRGDPCNLPNLVVIEIEHGDTATHRQAVLK